MILTQEQEMIRDTMRSIAQERLAPLVAQWDKKHPLLAAVLKEPGELGAFK
jgi:butyryl-CoA dehydrogenase